MQQSNADRTHTKIDLAKTVRSLPHTCRTLVRSWERLDRFAVPVEQMQSRPVLANRIMCSDAYLDFCGLFPLHSRYTITTKTTNTIPMNVDAIASPRRYLL